MDLGTTVTASAAAAAVTTTTVVLLRPWKAPEGTAVRVQRALEGSVAPGVQEVQGVQEDLAVPRPGLEGGKDHVEPLRRLGKIG